MGIDHWPLSGLMGLPPVVDEGAVAVIAGLEGADAVMLGIGDNRPLQAPGPHVVDGLLLPGLDLAPVHGQLAGAEPEPQGAEAAAGGDGGELAVVADQDHLGAGPLGVSEQRREFAGGDHGGLVHHQHRPPIQLHPAVGQVEQQPINRASVGVPFVGQPDGGDPGRRGPVDLVAVQLEGLPGEPQRPGLAAAGPPHHHRHPSAALGEVLDHGRLVLPDAGVAVQDLADQVGPDDGAALACPLRGAVDQEPLMCEQLRR
jgi:hypothetical protein